MKETEIRFLFKEKNAMILDYLESFTYPWEVLEGLGEELYRIGTNLSKDVFEERAEGVWIAKSANVAPTAVILPPSIICAGVEIRHCAFLRGKVFVGEGAVVGNSTEVKNSILLDKVQVPHYNYVGDSILGFRSHMGAGAVTSNIKSDQSEVKIRIGTDCLSTGRRKVGAFLGDGVEVGCHSVLNPGTVIGEGSNIYPLSMVRGYIPEKSIYKKAGEIVKKYERIEC